MNCGAERAIVWTMRVALIGAALVWLVAPCACARHEEARLDVKSVVALEALRATERHEAVTTDMMVERHRGPTVIDFPAWTPPSSDGGVARPRRPFKIVIGATDTKSTTHVEADAGTTVQERLTVDAGTTLAATATVDSKPSAGCAFGGGFAAAITLGAVVLGLLLWRARPWK